MHSCRVGLIRVAQQFEADTEQAAGEAGIKTSWVTEDIDLGIMPLREALAAVCVACAAAMAWATSPAVRR
jgi:hypothetical protein